MRAKSTIKAGTNKSSNILTYWVTGPEEDTGGDRMPPKPPNSGVFRMIVPI